MELLLYVSLSTRICEEWQTVVLVSLVDQYVRSKTVYSGLVKQAGGPAWTGALVGACTRASARLDVRHLHLYKLAYATFLSPASVEITSYDVVFCQQLALKSPPYNTSVKVSSLCLTRECNC